MPVIAIAGAIGAWALGGAAAVGAIGTAAFGIADAFTIAGAVGATLGAVGSITHDKGLETAGLVLGGIGGVGALAANAGLFGASATASSVFGADPEAVAVTPNAYSGAAGEVGNSAMQAAATSANTDIVNNLAGLKPDLTLPNVSIGDQVAAASGSASALTPDPLKSLTVASSTPSTAAPSALPTTLGLNAPAPVGTPPQVTGTSGLPPAAPGIVTPSAPVTGTPVDPNIESVNITAGNTSAQSPGIFKQIGDFFNSDTSGLAKYALLQSAGSLVGGLTDTLKPAQIDALNAQAAQNRAATSLSLQQQANLAAPIPVAKRAVSANVTGAPMPAGFINSTPSTITGAVA